MFDMLNSANVSKYTCVYMWLWHGYKRKENKIFSLYIIW